MSEILRRVQSMLLDLPAARAVLERSIADAANPASPHFRAAYARAARLLGSASSEPLVTLEPELRAARPHWTLLDWARLSLLLLALEHVAPEKRGALTLGLLESGEIGEQESLLRTLSLLPEPGRYIEVGVGACRTNARRIFEAIACENAFPAAFFPDLEFNQMVLKAIFIEVSATRIEGLALRTTPELCRMLRDYASERTAAGREVPADVDLVLSLGRDASAH